MLQSRMPATVTTLIISAAIFTGVVFAESPEERARRAIEEFCDTPPQEVVEWFDPSTLPPRAEQTIATMRQFLEVGLDPQITKINSGLKKSFTEDRRDDSFVFHLVGEEKAALVAISIRTGGGSMVLTGFRVEPAPRDLASSFPFVLRGVSWLHYVCLLLAVAFLLIQMAALIQCFRFKVRRKWLWVPFILVGIGQLSVTWVPGPLSNVPVRFMPIGLILFSASIVKSPIYAPWVLSIGFPLGALLFFRHLHKLRNAPPADPVSILSVDDLEFPDSGSPFGGR